MSSDDGYLVEREQMVHKQLERRGIMDPQVLLAMRNVPRHEFLPDHEKDMSYGDFPLPIGFGQTISQPYIVAHMTELAEVGKDSRVLEVGTGSGYQAAVLAYLCREVYSIELNTQLFNKARDNLTALGIKNFHLRLGDGALGWPEAAPFDAILVTAASKEVPESLFQQLREGGRMVIPVGDPYEIQHLKLVRKLTGGERQTETIELVQFVPLLGQGSTVSNL